jgi:SAM-dependent methyltransferase
MTTCNDIFRIEHNEAYLRDLQAEAAFWDDPPFNPFDSLPPVMVSYLNKSFTGNKLLSWYASFPRYGTFGKGCTIGLGWLDHDREILKSNPQLHLTFTDISPESLAQRESILEHEFPCRIAVQQTDLNFIELPENAYDFIVSDGCLHHVMNIEHVAFQVNRSLKSGGYFFLNDYVGESRFQFADEKKQFFERALEGLRPRHSCLRYWRPQWPATNAGGGGGGLLPF